MTRYTVSPDAACATVEDGAVVLNMRTKRYYSLNETGALVWRLLEDEMAVEDVVVRVVELYDVDAVVAARTIEALLDELTAEFLLNSVTT